MDPADSNPIHQVVLAQRDIIQRHEQQLATIARGLQEVSVHHVQLLESIWQEIRQLSTPVLTSSPLTPLTALETSSSASLPPLLPCHGCLLLSSTQVTLTLAEAS
ncbi:hypothetical protein LDENG_00227340 [Lucifuga dentata]|nr:hypothetical protein LDENG_00227340 [Lucifuga dentata]